MSILDLDKARNLKLVNRIKRLRHSERRVEELKKKYSFHQDAFEISRNLVSMNEELSEQCLIQVSKCMRELNNKVFFPEAEVEAEPPPPTQNFVTQHVFFLL